MKSEHDIRLNELGSELERLAELLRENGVSTWADRISADAAKLRAGNWKGASSYLGHFGTAGSFNECSIGTGNWVTDRRTGKGKHEGDQTYLEFEALRARTYVLARQVSDDFTPSLGAALVGAWLKSRMRTKLMLAVLGMLCVLLVQQLVTHGGN